MNEDEKMDSKESEENHMPDPVLDPVGFYKYIGSALWGDPIDRLGTVSAVAILGAAAWWFFC